MDRILITLKKKENGPRASSVPALGLNTIIFKYVYWYMKQISGERLQDHWSSGCIVYEPPHGKTNNLQRRKQRRRSACSNCEADQRLCFCYTDSTIPLLSKFKISSL